MSTRQWFRPGNATRSEAAARIHAWYELLYTAVDVTAGLLFTAGSVMFLLDADETLARSGFLLGSLLFLSKPVIRLARELALMRAGDTGSLADKALSSDPTGGRSAKERRG